MKCLSSEVDSEKFVTSVHRSSESSKRTSKYSNSLRLSTGASLTTKAWLGEPSETPRYSSPRVSACSAFTTPPVAENESILIAGDAS